MVLKKYYKDRYLLHFLSVLLGLQMLHKNLGGPEVFLADCAGGDGCSTGELRGDAGTPDYYWLFSFKATRNAVSTTAGDYLWSEQLITLCSSVRRWSVMLLVKWVWQVAHQCFKSAFFSLQHTDEHHSIVLCSTQNDWLEKHQMHFCVF